MSPRRTLALTLAAVVVAVAAPVWLAIQVAERQGLASESRRALSYARDVLGRSEAASDQIDAAFRAIAAVRGVDPCAPARAAR